MIDPKKQYKTRDGREVRIYAMDGGINHSAVHGAVFSDGYWSARQWFPNGQYFNGFDTHDLDLIEVKPRIKREVWVNVYNRNILGAYGSREMADANSARGRIACVKLTIDCEEGEGL